MCYAHRAFRPKPFVMFQLHVRRRSIALCHGAESSAVPLRNRSFNSLGSSNGPRNLWPQSESTVPWNSKLKDQLEIKLRTEACAGTTDLLAAQQEIATDWIAAYVARFGQPTQVQTGAK